MIEFHYEADFKLKIETYYVDWISRIIEEYGKGVGELCYIFTTDGRLHELNLKYLEHDTFTDILTFDYGSGDTVSGDIFISIERVTENAGNLEVRLEDEVRRVMAHGVLHLLGFNDDTAQEKERMRELENAKMKLFHVEH